MSSPSTTLSSYAPAGDDWAFQLWLDAWPEAALLERAIRAGVSDGVFRCDDPRGAAWRILSLVDGLALQVVAHRTTIERADMLAWAATATERELGLPAGSLLAPVAGGATRPRA